MIKAAPRLDSDKLLVIELKNGCIEAYDQLFKKYNNKLFYFALNYLNSTEEAEGVVQDVFAKVWEKKRALKIEYSFKGYIFTIAYNFIKKVYIRRCRQRDYLIAEERKSYADLDTIEKLDYGFTMERLKGLISKMPERRRETFTKSRLEGLSIKEIAQDMNVSPKTVENQIGYALKFIRSNWHLEKASGMY
ncbi:RNA polymerase sigma-70 factor [Flavivirga eckloniae]|uniref:RNA polymerase sigma-70 factor n=1 Tax=Flavivirga eckloniae TaxID=1803846 RepID=A0A2K9PU80_9FLAO|nr:RNA polymerase sigma-70 factor [Flavivirga eckloniae]AUP80612.1 RNA polymerase sigma-70 factor [Flavivirga eckloniae]